ncbi:unnamed protein product [Symbiodinium sp. CCMP2456]|nr:unnamed protein product [Symbiodinium sp. CCMP2456]
MKKESTEKAPTRPEVSEEAEWLASELEKEDSLQGVGFNLLVDRTGQLLKEKRQVSRKDVELNPRVIAAVLRGSRKGRKRYSAHLIADAVRLWYFTKKLTPRGISVNAPSVQDWSLKATKFKRLSQRARSSRNKAIKELKDELIDYLPKQDAGSGDESSDDGDATDEGSDGEVEALEALGECEADVRSASCCQFPELGYHSGYFYKSLVQKYRKLSLASPTSVASKTMVLDDGATSEVSTAVSSGDSAVGTAKTEKLNAIFLRLKQQKLKKLPEQMQNTFVVPPAVLSNIQAMSKDLAPTPFLPSSQWKGEYVSDCEDADPEECEPIQDEKPEAKTPKAKGKAKAKAKAKARAAGQDAPAAKVRIEVDAPHADCNYVPGEFRKRKKAYVQDCTKSGYLTYWEALQAWNFSDERAQLLQNLSPSELSRRRFD